VLGQERVLEQEQEQERVLGQEQELEQVLDLHSWSLWQREGVIPVKLHIRSFSRLTS